MPKADARRRAGRIGAWRLLDLVHATMPWRAAMPGGASGLPEYGPPDATSTVDPVAELPDSNIDEGERAGAVERERARRFVRARSAGR